VTNRETYDPTITAIAIMAAIRESGVELFPKDQRHIQRLYGKPLQILFDQIAAFSNRAGWRQVVVAWHWHTQWKDFAVARRPFLLYPE
jgi:hypothetical protein